MSQTAGVTHAAPEPVSPASAPVRWRLLVGSCLAAFGIAGLAGGWLWKQYAPDASYLVDAAGASLDEEQMTRVFGPDGAFVVIGFAAALLVGGLVFWWLRGSGPWAVTAVVLSSLVGSGVAYGLGMLLGHDPLDPRLRAARPGDLVAAPLEIHAWTALASWPVGAALAVTILAALQWRHEITDAAQPSPSEQTPWRAS